jgi:hypothetical protein
MPFDKIVYSEELSPNSPEFFKLINNRLRAFDEIAYDCLRCDSIDDILKKHFFHDDMAPLFQSIEKIASDPQMWDASLRQDLYTHERVRAMCEADRAKNDEIVAAETIPILPNPKFVPLFMQLRPFDSSKGFASQFRLFFVEGNIIAATQVSIWSFHEEHYEFRNSVINAIATFASSLSTKQLVRSAQKASSTATVSSAGGSDSILAGSSASAPALKLDLNFTGSKPAVENEKDKVRMSKVSYI